jgi:hypothetical protein
MLVELIMSLVSSGLLLAVRPLTSDHHMQVLSQAKQEPLQLGQSWLPVYIDPHNMDAPPGIDSPLTYAAWSKQRGGLL